MLDCVPLPEVPGELTEISAVADDGQPVRSWMVVPHGDEPAPLLLWIHGGPLASWNAWHWRWNPWLMVAQGYAVLLPRSGPVHRIRPAVRPTRVGRVGIGTVHPT